MSLEASVVKFHFFFLTLNAINDSCLTAVNVSVGTRAKHAKRWNFASYRIVPWEALVAI